MPPDLRYLRNSDMDANEVLVLITGANKAYAVYKVQENIYCGMQ
jgi:hypothetical protein